MLKDISRQSTFQLAMFRQLVVCVGLGLALAQESIEVSRKPAPTASEFPYQVLISQLDERPKCGGVLVGESFIVTSATCVLDFGGIKKFLEEALLYGGGTRLLFNLGDVSDAVIHPQYTVNPTTFDVAVVKYIPEEKGPRLNFTLINGMISDQTSCVMSSWWEAPDQRPEHLMWLPLVLAPCSPPNPNLLCFTGDNALFYKDDLGSPVVCGGVLTGMIPRGGGKTAINLSSDYDWLVQTMEEMAKVKLPSDSTTDEDTKHYLLQILEKVNVLSNDKPASDHLTNWNNQIVVPLSYVLFAMVIFFFVLLFFIILFTVVLVYYSRK